MSATLTLLGKEISLFLKDKTAILLTFLVPFFIIYLVGNIFSGMGSNGGLSSNIKVAALNLSGDEAGDLLIEALASEDGLEIVRKPSSEAETFTETTIRQGIEDHDYNFALVVPPEYQKEDGIGIKLLLLTNPENQIESQIVNGLIQKAVFTKLPQLLGGQLDQYQREQMGDEKYEVFLDGIASLVSLSFDDADYDEVRANVGFEGLTSLMSDGGEEGEDSDNAGSFIQDLVQFEEDQVYGKEVKNPYLTRMVGGYAIMFLLFATTGSASSLFEERNEGIFVRLLSMPVKRTHILWSKFLFNTLMGITQALVLFIVSSFLYDIEVFENFIPLLVVSIFAAASCTAFGMFLASISKTPQQANGLGTLLIISMSALGGAWFPVSIMPEAIQFFSKFTLVYWGVEAYLGALWEEGSLITLIPTLSVIFGITTALMALSSWRFRTGDLFR